MQTLRTGDSCVRYEGKLSTQLPKRLARCVMNMFVPLHKKSQWYMTLCLSWTFEPSLTINTRKMAKISALPSVCHMQAEVALFELGALKTFTTKLIFRELLAPKIVL